MAFQFFSSDFLTIDIGFRYIKIIRVRKNKNGYLVIVNYGIGDTPKGCIKNGAIKEKERVIEEIKRVINEHGLQTKEAKIVMSGTNIITRIIMVDKVSEKLIDKAVWDEINKSIPINIEEHRVDYKILDVVNDNGREKMRVFVTAVAKNIIDSYIDILKSLNLKPISIDIPANSASKLFQKEIIHMKTGNWFARQNFANSSEDTVAVLDMGSETTIVNILKNKIPEFNRVLLIGSSNIDNEIMKKMGLQGNQSDLAERYKKMYGLAVSDNKNNEVEQQCGECAKIVVNDIIKNVRMCFDFYIKRCGGETISKIYLVGGGSKLKGIKDYFEETFNISVYPIDQIHVNGVEFSEGLDSERINFLINAIGVAL